MSDWTNTGLIRYTGPNLTYENITICNGDILTDAIVKIKQIIDLIDTQLAIDVSIPGCLTIDTTSIKTIFQDIIDYLETIICTLIPDLQTDVSTLISDLNALEIIVNALPASPTIVDQSTESIDVSGSTYSFKGFVPIGAVISYFGLRSEFNGSGIGMGRMANWAICDGQNGRPNLCDRFIKYSCDCCINADDGDNHFNGRTEYKLAPSNIPYMELDPQTVEIGGRTNDVSDHTHSFVGDTDLSYPALPDQDRIETDSPAQTGDPVLVPANSNLIKPAGGHFHELEITAEISPATFGFLDPSAIPLDPLHKKALPIIRIS